MIEIQKFNNKKKFSEMLKKVSFKFPIAEIASSTGYSKGSVSEILKENRSPTDEFLKKFSEAYNIDLSEFEDGSLEDYTEQKKELFNEKELTKDDIIAFHKERADYYQRKSESIEGKIDLILENNKKIDFISITLEKLYSEILSVKLLKSIDDLRSSIPKKENV
jgi:transcriptional regulator with XRE-family HTH domain